MPISENLHTSKRMHFIEENATIPRLIEETLGTDPGVLVTDLHTSKRMHFIEE